MKYFFITFHLLLGVSISNDVLFEIQRRCCGITNPCYDMPLSASLYPCEKGQVLHIKNTVIRSAAHCHISEMLTLRFISTGKKCVNGNL